MSCGFLQNRGWGGSGAPTAEGKDFRVYWEFRRRKIHTAECSVPPLRLETGEVSQKLGRGRHTTREVELYKLQDGGYVADTPGFSTFDIERYRLTDKEKLAFGFREFAPYLEECQFSSCSHTCEKGCAILQAVEEGKIPRSRFESYCAMYEEIKDVKQWQQKSRNA